KQSDDHDSPILKLKERAQKGIHYCGPRREIDSRRQRHRRSVEAERVDHAHRLALSDRFAIASGVLPRATRGVRIFHDVMLQALHFAPPDYHYYGRPPVASWRRFSFG